MTTEQLAAIVASGLVGNDLYKRCTRRSDYHLNQDATYVLDTDAVARDAMAVAVRIEEMARERGQKIGEL